VVHPEDAKVLGVGDDVPRLDLEHEFGRQDDPYHPQALAAAVDDGRDVVADGKLVRVGKFLARQHLIVATWR
jgi:hypothetical protein